MGNIVITTSTRRDMITGAIIESKHSSCHIDIEDDVEQLNFYTFIYCAAAMHVYPFSVPGSYDDLNDFRLDEKPECHVCDFKQTYRWDSNIERFSSVDQSAYEYPTHLYKELMADGSLRNNTTYIEIVKAYERECESDVSGPFEAGKNVACPVCDDEHDVMVVKPSIDELKKEEKDDEQNERFYYAEGTNGLWSIFITDKMKTKFQNTLDKCLLMKKFIDVYPVIFHDDSGEVIETYRRLLTPKHRKHFLGLGVPMKYKSKKQEWQDFLSES